jgi:O-Antigen ligase
MLKTLNKHTHLSSFSVYSIRKTTIEWIGLISLFVFSFINSFTLLIFLVTLLLLFKQKEVGAIKILNLITLRTIINPGIAVDIALWQNFKWGILFLCSLYLINSYNKLESNQRKKIKKTSNFVIFFMIYNIVTALIFSTLPTIAVFKLLSYGVIFLGIFIGISYTHTKFDWINWSYKMYLILFLPSLPMIFMSVGYLRNGHAFQGLTNQPNMFGILATLFIGLIFTSIQTNKVKFSIFTMIFMISLTMYMIILSESRTSFITSIVLIIIYIAYAKISRIFRVISINLFGAILIVFISIENSIIGFVSGFLYKGKDSFLASRTDQVDGLLSNFLRNPWFGNGFNVPVTPYRTFAFNSEYFVEPGNLIMAVLSFSGIIGFIIFTVYISRIFLANKKEFKNMCFLPISTILISMGEMVFFSSNNMAILCYMFLSMYVFNENKNFRIMR